MENKNKQIRKLLDEMKQDALNMKEKKPNESASHNGVDNYKHENNINWEKNLQTINIPDRCSINEFGEIERPSKSK